MIQKLAESSLPSSWSPSDENIRFFSWGDFSNHKVDIEYYKLTCCRIKFIIKWKSILSHALLTMNLAPMPKANSNRLEPNTLTNQIKCILLPSATYKNHSWKALNFSRIKGMKFFISKFHVSKESNRLRQLLIRFGKPLKKKIYLKIIRMRWKVKQTKQTTRSGISTSQKTSIWFQLKRIIMWGRRQIKDW